MFDFIVVGSGAGGATVARELSRAGKKVLLLEKGKAVPQGAASKTYTVIPSDVEIWQTVCLGGTTAVTMGNAVRSPLNSKLDPFFAEAEEDLNAWTIPLSKMGPATRLLLDLSRDWTPMPKAIDLDKCKSCGVCASGCPSGAKWDASVYVREATSRGCTLATNAPVKKVLIEGKKAIGVETSDGRVFKGKSVVLAAGAIESPRILVRSGFEFIGKGLFVDTFITVGGMKKDIGLSKELGMALYMMREGYLLSPHYSSFLIPELAKKGIAAKATDILGLMVKISDEPAGEVKPTTVVKGLTERDTELLETGKREAIDLLTVAGVDEKTIVTVHPRGAHPGGTCSSVVRSVVKPWTDVDSLYISDASVIPGPFGLPPMLTIIAISKQLSARLLGRS